MLGLLTRQKPQNWLWGLWVLPLGPVSTLYCKYKDLDSGLSMGNNTLPFWFGSCGWWMDRLDWLFSKFRPQMICMVEVILLFLEEVRSQLLSFSIGDRDYSIVGELTWPNAGPVQGHQGQAASRWPEAAVWKRNASKTPSRLEHPTIQYSKVQVGGFYASRPVIVRF